MRNTISATLTASVLGALLAGLAAPAQAGEVVDQPSIPFFFFCRSNGGVANTFYFSTTQQAAAGTARKNLEGAYHVFLTKTYKYPNDASISCIFAVSGDLQARTESTRRQTMENLRTAHFEVVETTAWKYAK